MAKAVISIIKGGLGNQLFIYAAGRAFALRTGRELYLDIKRGFVQNGYDDYDRCYRLVHFPIQAAIMPESWRVGPSLRHFQHKSLRAWNKLLPADWRSYLAQRWHLSSEQLTERKPIRERVTLNGHWPDEAYFADHADAIRKELQPPAPKDELNLRLGEAFSAEDTVFVHARRVRYPSLLLPDYYHAAVRGIREKVANPKFVVFSDDPQWTRDHLDFEGCPVQWVEHNATDELADLWLMSRCQHAIIANSSFSWWGAWLGNARWDRRVIYTPDHPDWIIRPAKGWHCIPFEI